jgi:hypothetical protein
LSTSANLLGFVFFVLASIKSLGVPHSGFIDEIASICIALFAISCMLSFASVRSASDVRSRRFELIADYLFFSGLLIMTTISLLLAFDFVEF